MARTTHTRPTEYGSKARKLEGKDLRGTDRKAAIAEGLEDVPPEEAGTVTEHEFSGEIEGGFYVCTRCGGAEHIHEFGPWDHTEGGDLAAIVGDRLFEQEELPPAEEID